jgi:hypothetical protein
MHLARAEIRLVAARSHLLAVRVVVLWVAVVVTTSAAQVALLLIALAPVLLTKQSPSAFFVAFLPSIALSGLGGVLAWRAWRGLRRDPGNLEQARQ